MVKKNNFKGGLYKPTIRNGLANGGQNVEINSHSSTKYRPLVFKRGFVCTSELLCVRGRGHSQF